VSNSSFEAQKVLSIASLRRHEAARDRAAKSKYVPVAIALELAAEIAAEIAHDEESAFVAEQHDHETEDIEIE
jgi:hypothetical protein